MDGGDAIVWGLFVCVGVKEARSHSFFLRSLSYFTLR
jgi:hypothetical protein